MKKFLKFFSTIFLFFMTATTCFAINDCRFVKNQKLIDEIKKQVDLQDFIKAYDDSEEKLYVDYTSSIFMVNTKDISKTFVATPILKTKEGLIGEVITVFKIENAITINDILNNFTSSASNMLEFQPHISFTKFFQSYRTRYISIEYIISSLKVASVTPASTDKIFYSVPIDEPIENFDNAQLTYENIQGDTKRFVFQNPSSTKLTGVSSPNNQKNPIQCLKHWFLSYCSKKERGYVKLSDSQPQSLFEFDKVKSE